MYEEVCENVSYDAVSLEVRERAYSTELKRGIYINQPAIWYIFTGQLCCIHERRSKEAKLADKKVMCITLRWFAGQNKLEKTAQPSELGGNGGNGGLIKKNEGYTANKWWVMSLCHTLVFCYLFYGLFPQTLLHVCVLCAALGCSDPKSWTTLFKKCLHLFTLEENVFTSTCSLGMATKSIYAHKFVYMCPLRW